MFGWAAFWRPYVAVSDGYVSVTPLQPDLTAHAHLDLVAGLRLTRTAAR